MTDAIDVAIDVCAEFEGFSATPYKDMVGVPTIGYGTTVYPTGVKVTMADRPVTQAQAREFKRAHLMGDLKTLGAVLGKVSLTANQMGAVLSLAYNVGINAIVASTLVRLLKSGADPMTVAAEFPKWCNAGGKPVKGLLRRRYFEAYKFLTP